MAKYFYKENRNPVDYTEEIILEVNEQGDPVRSVFRGGAAEEIADNQYRELKDRFVLEPADSTDSQEKARDIPDPPPVIGVLPAMSGDDKKGGE